MTVCIECAIQAVLKGENPASASRFDESPEVYAQRLHSQPIPPDQRAQDLQEICDRLNRGDMATHKALRTPVGLIALLCEDS